MNKSAVPETEVTYDDVFDENARTCMAQAVAASMDVVRRFQLSRCTDPLGTKSDGTLSALSADKASEAAGKEFLRQIPGIQIQGEETGKEGDESDIIVCLDALDGSMPFAVGAGTSTVIAAAYSRKNREVFYSMVANPQTGQVWLAKKGCPTKVILNRRVQSEVAGCTVSTEPISPKTRVFIDSYPGFKRDGREILSRSELNRLEGLIDEKAGKLMLGSNGIHHALVAHGGKGAVGAITTAIGGWWDVCPVLLVTQAGGYATAFRVGDTYTEGDALFKSRGTLIECNPLDVMSYDILVTANSPETLAVLVDAIRRAKSE